VANQREQQHAPDQPQQPAAPSAPLHQQKANNWWQQPTQQQQHQQQQPTLKHPQSQKQPSSTPAPAVPTPATCPGAHSLAPAAQATTSVSTPTNMQEQQSGQQQHQPQHVDVQGPAPSFGKFKVGDAVLYFDNAASKWLPAVIEKVDFEGLQYGVLIEGMPFVRHTVEERLSHTPLPNPDVLMETTGHRTQHHQKYADLASFYPEITPVEQQTQSPAEHTVGATAPACDKAEFCPLPDADSEQEQPLSPDPELYCCINGDHLPFGPAEVQRLMRPFTAPGTSADYLNDEIVNISLDMFTKMNHGNCTKRCLHYHHCSTHD
jgi:hypothetical protein